VERNNPSIQVKCRRLGRGVVGDEVTFGDLLLSERDAILTIYLATIQILRNHRGMLLTQNMDSGSWIEIVAQGLSLHVHASESG
jgi:hypothetical protein